MKGVLSMIKSLNGKLLIVLKLKKEKSKVDLVETEKKRLKLKKYQEKLKSLGYSVNTTGILDNKTIIAHHKYLKKKKRKKRNQS